MKIYTHSKFLPEKKYVFDFLFPCAYELVVEENHTGYYRLVTPNGNVLKLQDVFFSAGNEDCNSIYQHATLPQKAFNNFKPHFSNQEVISLYGNSNLSTEEAESGFNFTYDSDLVAAVFFMLSRWEEYLPQEYDRFGRIKPTNNIAVKLGFSTRPVVDEWRSFVWDLLKKLDPSVKEPKPEGYRLNPTHDVDILHYPADILNMLGDLKNVRNPVAPFKRLAYKFKGFNPYNTFDFLMDMSERNNVPSIFYFMADGKSALDNKYRNTDPFLKELVKNVRNRNHHIGLHPGFETFTDPDEFIRQKHYVENYTGQQITHNRQHYLRLRLPETLIVWEKAGIENDSSLGFTQGVGYRCGTGGSFPLFHVTERRKTKVTETPLVFMEVAIRSYADLSKSRADSLMALRTFKQFSQKFQTPFTFLFHNSSFDDIRWPGWQKLYTDFLSEA